MNPAPYVAGYYLEGKVQIHIPPYQRTYEWDAERWIGLWRDVAHQYRQKIAGVAAPPHFMGVLLLEPRAAPAGSGATATYVVDGQQRLLTLLVLLAALRDHAAAAKGQQIDPDNELNTIKDQYAAPTDRLVVRRQNTQVIEPVLRGELATEIPDAVFSTGIAQAYRFFRY